VCIACFCCVECESEHEIDCYGNGTECVAAEKQCDGIAHCSNGKDESVELCGRSQEGIQCHFRVFIDNLLDVVTSVCDTNMLISEQVLFILACFFNDSLS